MRLVIAALVLAACDPGEVVCTPASEPAYCGGQLAQGCSAVKNGKLVNEWIHWTDAKGRTVDVWECEAFGCSDHLPYGVVCHCFELEGTPDTGLEAMGCE